VPFLLDKDRLVAPAEEVAAGAVAAVRPLRIAAVQLAHAAGEVRVGCLEQQVVVGSQQALGVTEKVVAGDHALKQRKEGCSVELVQEEQRSSSARADAVV